MRRRVIVAVVSLVGVIWGPGAGNPASPATLAQAPRFAAARGYVVPLIPSFVQIADMNGAGRPDIVTAGQDNIVSIVRNRGHRTFAPSADYFGGQNGYFLTGAAVADLNGDGFPDVATGSFQEGIGQGAISVLINDGAGGLLPPIIYRIPQAPGKMAAGDVNGDGHPDLAVALDDIHSSKRMIGIFLNQGDGTLGLPVPYPAVHSDSACVLADLNGDHAYDVVVLDETAGLLGVLVGDGLGGFGAETTYPVGAFPVSLAVGDVNHDRRPDAVVGLFDGSGQLLLNAGDGTFGAASPIDLGTGGGAPYLAIADLQPDGNPDIVATSGVGWVRPLLGAGDGTFSSGRTFGAGALPEGVAAGDLDGDGIADLAVLGNPGTVLPLFGFGAGQFHSAFVQTLANGFEFVGTFGATDISGDGLPDLVIGGGLGGAGAPVPDLAISMNQGGGVFGAPTAYPMTSDPTGFAAADLNGDGTLDLVASLAANDDQNVAVLIGTGGGAFAPPSFISVVNFPAGIVAGDFNNDTEQDIGLCINNTGINVSQVTVLPGLGDGNFGSPITSSLGHPAPIAIVASHFNADPNLDVALLVSDDQGTSNEFLVPALGTGSGSFTASGQYRVGEDMGALAIADLNGDQLQDVVATSPGTDELSTVLGAGDGTFAAPVLSPLGNAPHWLAVTDFTGDGTPDAVVSDDYGMLWSMPGLGDGTFGRAIGYATAQGQIAAGDLNGDGLLDVAGVAEDHLIVALFLGIS